MMLGEVDHDVRGGGSCYGRWIMMLGDHAKTYPIKGTLDKDSKIARSRHTLATNVSKLRQFCSSSLYWKNPA